MRFGTLRFGALCMGLATLLHIVFFFFAGSSELVLAALAAAAAAGLWQGWRWFGWLVMLGLIVAIGVALARIGSDPVPDALLYGLVFVDSLTVLSIFLALWRLKTLPV